MSVNVVKCQNGHFFDGDNYTMCPHCGSPIASENLGEKDKNGKKGLFGRKNHDKLAKNMSQAPFSMQMPQNYQQPQSIQPQQFSSVTEAIVPQSNGVEINGVSVEDRGHTIDFWGPASTPSESRKYEEPKETVTEATLEIKTPIENVVTETETVSEIIPTSEPVPVTPAVQPAPAKEEPSASDSLKDVVQKASSNSTGKTMGYFERVNKSAGTSAPAAASGASAPAAVQRRSNGPVVGWLVCISGAHMGQSFELGAGKNSIGRSEENNVVLCNDGGVSGNKHALIVYEPKKREFYLQPGDSSGLTYLNEEFITEIKHLENRDIIELGDSKLMFIPLCCQEFSWEEYLK